MQRGKHREIRGRKWRLAGFSFGKLFVHVFVTTKYEMKEEKVQVGVQSRERKSIGKDGRSQLHAPPVPPEPSLVLPEATAGEGRYSPHFFCVRLHLTPLSGLIGTSAFCPVSTQHQALPCPLPVTPHHNYLYSSLPQHLCCSLQSCAPWCLAPGRWPINVG